MAEHLEFLRADPDMKTKVDAIEYSVYVHAITESKYKAILNEKIPPVSDPVALPPNFRFNLIPKGMREAREHPGRPHRAAG